MSDLPAGIEARFTTRDDRVVDVELSDEWRPFTDTLLDAVTTRAPRGSDGVNPSTFWIDRTLSAIDQATSGTVVASGNATDLVLDGDMLVAQSHYDLFDDQRMERSQLVHLLQQWRLFVIHLRETAGPSS